MFVSKARTDSCRMQPGPREGQANFWNRVDPHGRADPKSIRARCDGEQSFQLLVHIIGETV